MGDSPWWNRDSFKRGCSESDLPPQPYLSAMPLPHPLHLWSHPLFQNFAQPAIPQYPVHTHEQEMGGQQGGTKTCPSDKSESSEFPGPSTDGGRRSSHSASSDPNDEDSHMGEARAPYNHAGGFVFPVPYPGQLDPSMLWMHHMQRQMAYLYSTSGCRNGYQHPTSISSNGGSQRGFIKIPSGIPQKQSRLWETQSTENMQLWATVTQLSAIIARAEAEIFCQRAKISKLEDDIQVMKARQDAMSEALKGRTFSPQSKRVRRKRTVTAPVAILGLPASQPLPEKAQVKKARGIISERDISHSLADGRFEETQLDSNLECTNRSMQSVSGNCTSLTVGLDRKESLHGASRNDKVEGEHGGNDNACIGDIVVQHGSQNSCGRDSIPAETTIKTSCSPIKQDCGDDDKARCNEGAVASQREEVCLTESVPLQVLGSGDCNTDSKILKMGELCIVEDRALQPASTDCSTESESIYMMRKGNWLERIGGSEDGSLPHRSGVLETAIASYSGNGLLCAGEKLEMMASEQESKNNNEVTLEDLTVARISDYLVVCPETSVLREPLMFQ